MLCPVHGTRVRPLPDAASLPVVLAARISLSFPGLISAVPLLCVDYSRGPGHRNLIRTWFSDGGIASNFPMHFFDAPWPGRPTFGINLEAPHPDFPDEMVWRPRNGASGVVPRSREITSVAQFFLAMVKTMQNWTDSTQITLPGFRDRVTEVRTDPKKEGGLNLKMTDETIHTLATRGSDAANEFEDFDLDLHEWIRYRASMNSVSDTLDTMQSRYERVEDGEGYQQFIKRYGPTPADFSLARASAVTAAAVATDRLMRLARKWQRSNYPLTAPRVPEPRPQLRQMPPL
jgi:hypothetical protein